MKRSFTVLMDRTVSVKDYLVCTSDPFRSKSIERMKNYRLKEVVVEELKKYADKLFIVVFSAELCLKDCAKNVPVLALLADKAGLKVRVFGGLMRDSLNPKEKWRIPPSPPEVKEFKVEKVPHIVIFDMSGLELGKIVEKPAHDKTLEEEILQRAWQGFHQL